MKFIYNILYDLYVVKGLSTREVGKELNKAQTTIRRWFKKYNIPTRTSREGKQTEHYIKKISPKWEALKVRVTQECVVCGKSFETMPCKTKKTCSNECKSKLMSSTNKRKPRTKACVYCNKEFEYRNSNRKYCSSECYRAHKKEEYVPLTLVCKNCGKTYYKTRTFKNQVYCSVECMSEHYSKSGMWRKENSPTWKGGLCKKDVYGDTWYRARRLARNRDKKTCQLCSKTEAENKAQMSVHHIRPFRLWDNHIEANSLTNLVCLCHECHSFVHSKANVDKVFLDDEEKKLVKDIV